MAGRKKICLLLALLLIAITVLGGCQNSGLDGKLDPKNPVSIEIWHYYNGPQKTEFDRMVTEFNETVGKEKGIIVEAFSQGNSISALVEKVMDAANKKVGAGKIPDVFAAYADTAYQVDQLGLVASLDAYLTKEELDEYITPYIEEGRFDQEGSLKIFPIAKSTELFMLNKTDWDLFAAATGAKEEDLQTMEGLCRVAESYYQWTDSLTPEENDGKAFFGRDAMANYIIIGSKQLGTEIFSVKNGQVTFQVDQTIMRKLWDNYYVPYISGYFASYGKFRSDDAKTGDIIALVGSTSGAAYFPDKVTVNDTENYPIEVKVFQAPGFEGAQKCAVQQGAGMVVTKSNETKEYAATVFLKWFTEAKRNIAFSVGSGYLPVKKQANDVQMVSEALEMQEDSTVTINLKKSLPVAIEQANTYELYTNKAFEGGTKARNVLETSMQNKAKEDRAAVVELMNQSVSHKDAVARYNTDENFSAWLDGFKKELTAAVQ